MSMLGALGGLLAVSYLLVRDARYIVPMSVVYVAVALLYTFGVPL